MHLPHEIVKGECRSCDVEQCVERVRKVIQEGIRRMRVEHYCTLLVA